MSFSVHYRLTKEVKTFLAGHFHRPAFAVRALQLCVPLRVVLALIEVRHDLGVTPVCVPEEAQIVRRLTDMLTTDDDVRPLLA